MGNSALGVVILAYGAGDRYLPLAESLLGEGIEAGRIVVVHNPSEPDQAAPPVPAGCRLLRAPYNLGYAAGMNLGVKAQLEGDSGEIIGMVGVQHHEESVGEIRRLRVRQDQRRRGVGSALLETALQFCQQQGYLKIHLDTFMEREPAVKLFEKFNFRHSRTRCAGEKEVLHFYLDLYQRDGGARQRAE